MPLSFPRNGKAAQIVGQTPWSARVPLDPRRWMRVGMARKREVGPVANGKLSAPDLGAGKRGARHR